MSTPACSPSSAAPCTAIPPPGRRRRHLAPEPNLLTLTACTLTANTARFEAGAINARFNPPAHAHPLHHHRQRRDQPRSQRRRRRPQRPGAARPRRHRAGQHHLRQYRRQHPRLPQPPRPTYDSPQGNNLVDVDAKLSPLAAAPAPPRPCRHSPAARRWMAHSPPPPPAPTSAASPASAPPTSVPPNSAAPPTCSFYWLRPTGTATASRFGVEHALGTDPLRPDRNNSRNLTVAHHRRPGPRAAHLRRERRRTPRHALASSPAAPTLDPGSFTEIFRYDGTSFFFNNTQVSVVDNGTTITVIDRVPPRRQSLLPLRSHRAVSFEQNP